MSRSTPRVDMDPQFERLVKESQVQAGRDFEADVNLRQRRWWRPPAPQGDSGDEQPWHPDFFDIEGMSAPFSREALRAQVAQAVQDPANPGAVGDAPAASMQSDYLAAAERAFRARHGGNRIRGMLQASGRLQGHAQDRGVLVRQLLEPVRRVIEAARADDAEAGDG